MTAARDDQLARLEHLLGRLLVGGVAVSAVCLAAGLAASMAAWPASDSILDVGLGVLMATPILRVVVSLVEYARQRDRVFTAATLAVLLVLGGTLYAAWRAVH